MALIGREDELADVGRRLELHRLVTVIGPGGVGKTALARAAAEQADHRYPLGLHVVDLTRVSSADAVPGALAGQLGFDSFDALLGSPGDQPALLLVDNCEHVLDAAAVTIGALLDACRQPTVLATSRSPLDLPGECLVALAPLRTTRHTADDRAGIPAVNLFLARAHEGGATLPAGELASLEQLCRQLDGLPLAIEIAAARARTMSVTEISERLVTGVAVLDRPRFRGPRRHRSVADTIRWSYGLLDPRAQPLLQQLAVFAGPFTAAAAHAVAGVDESDVGALLDELVHAALVSVDTSEATTRYRLLDTVRRFALGELADAAHRDVTYERFVDHVLTSSQRALAEATTVWRPGLLRQLLDSFDDVAEATRWCNEHDADGARALALCAVLWPVVQQGRADDIVTLVRDTTERWASDDAAGAAAAATLATAECVVGHPALALALAEERLARRPPDDAATVPLCRVAGQARHALGDAQGASVVLRRGADVARRLGMTAMAVELEIGAAQIDGEIGDAAVAREVIARLGREATAIGSAVNEAWAQTADAWLALREDPAGAIALIAAALDHARAIDYPSGVVANLRSLALAHLALEQLPAAADAIGELLDELVGSGMLNHLRPLVDVAAILAHRRDDPAWRPLAATIDTLPVTLLACARPSILPLPAAAAPPVPRREIVATVRSVLHHELPRASDTGASASVARLRSIGDSWEITYDGRRVVVRRSKGLGDLVRLLAAPERDIDCLDLLGAAVEERSTGELIDAVARRQYEQRIRDLQQDVDDAEQDHDLGRAERAQAELDQLVEHLAAALGHRGRARRAAGTAERARSAVTQRLRATIRQLEALHPELGRHLRRAIKTGRYCRYEPDQPTTWQVDDA